MWTSFLPHFSLRVIAPTADALKLQQPLTDESLVVVRGWKSAGADKKSSAISVPKANPTRQGRRDSASRLKFWFTELAGRGAQQT
jgi:hypothetical protein